VEIDKGEIMSKNVPCVDIEGKKFEVNAANLSFRPAVYGVIIKNGKILLSKQWDGYSFPGGAIELGETILESVKRELKEETGLNVEVGKLIDCKESFFKLPYSDKFVHSILLFYMCEIIDGDLSLDNLAQDEKDTVSLPEWIDLAKTKELKFMSTINCVEIINKAINAEG